jgi:hypothetical protein
MVWYGVQVHEVAPLPSGIISSCSSICLCIFFDASGGEVTAIDGYVTGLTTLPSTSRVMESDYQHVKCFYVGLSLL